MTNPSGEVARPSRRERRIINFLAPQLQANEQIDLILGMAYENEAAGYPIFAFARPAAIVLTNQRVFEIRLQRLTARPKRSLAAHTRANIAAEWTRNALLIGGSRYSGDRWIGRLRITSPVGTKTFWVDERQRDRAQAIAAALNADRT